MNDQSGAQTFDVMPIDVKLTPLALRRVKKNLREFDR
jgi:hypothetical protein